MKKETEFFGSLKEEENERSEEAAENISKEEPKKRATNFWVIFFRTAGLGILYFAAVNILFSATEYFFLKNLVALILALLLLAFFDAALKQPDTDGSPYVIGLLFCFVLSLACHYFGLTNVFEKANDSTPASVSVQPAQPENQAISISTRGSFPMQLAEGQTSGWIEVDPTFSYTFSNHEATFYLTYEDGSIARSWEKGAWPKKYKFKVTNVSKERFDLITK